MPFPLFLNLAGRLGVVVGGGEVGRRKATALLADGARVRLVCLEPRPAEWTDAHLEWRTEAYRPEHLDGADLVFVAAPPEVNRAVTQDVRRRRLWVNVADDPQASDFLMPAVLRRGDFTIAVGTGGASPGLAREVRLLLESHFDESFSQWVALLAELRPLVLAQVPDAARRRALLQSLCRWEWLERLRREGADAVREAMRAELQLISNVPGKPGE